MEILVVLWRRGALTVRQVHEELEAHKAAGYTTVLKLMQIMAEKGLVRRDESERAHVYAAAVGREAMQGQVLTDVMEKLFGGSAAELVMSALAARPASKAELKRIRALLDGYEGGKR